MKKFGKIVCGIIIFISFLVFVYSIFRFGVWTFSLWNSDTVSGWNYYFINHYGSMVLGSGFVLIVTGAVDALAFRNKDK